MSRGREQEMQRAAFKLYEKATIKQSFRKKNRFKWAYKHSVAGVVVSSSSSAISKLQKNLLYCQTENLWWFESVWMMCCDVCRIKIANSRFPISENRNEQKKTTTAHRTSDMTITNHATWSNDTKNTFFSFFKEQRAINDDWCVFVSSDERFHRINCPLSLLFSVTTALCW